MHVLFQAGMERERGLLLNNHMYVYIYVVEQYIPHVGGVYLYR